jgi:hypothetical protein
MRFRWQKRVVQATRLIAMVQTTNCRYRNNRTQFDRLYRSRFWAIFLQGYVRSGPMIISRISRKMVLEGAFIEYDQVIQTLPPDAVNQPFNVTPLPRNVPLTALAGCRSSST